MLHELIFKSVVHFSRNRNWKTRYYWCIMGMV